MAGTTHKGLGADHLSKTMQPAHDHLEFYRVGGAAADADAPRLHTGALLLFTNGSNLTKFIFFRAKMLNELVAFILLRSYLVLSSCLSFHPRFRCCRGHTS